MTRREALLRMFQAEYPLIYPRFKELCNKYPEYHGCSLPYGGQGFFTLMECYSFTWDNTREGWEYWRSLSRNDINSGITSEVVIDALGVCHTRLEENA